MGVGVFVALGEVLCQGLGRLTAERVGEELVSECSEEAQEQGQFVDPWCPSQQSFWLADHCQRLGTYHSVPLLDMNPCRQCNKLNFKNKLYSSIYNTSA